MYCTGSFYYWNFFNVIPYYVENWMNCHMSIIGRILNVSGINDVSFLNTREFSFSTFQDIFECSSNANWDSYDGLAASEGTNYYDRDNLAVSLLPNLGFEWIQVQDFYSRSCRDGDGNEINLN